MVRKIDGAWFKEQCLALLDEVGPDGIIITRHGKPVAKLISIATRHASLIGALKGKLVIKKDMLSTGLRRDVES